LRAAVSKVARLKILILVLLPSVGLSCAAHYSPIYWNSTEWFAPGTATAGSDVALLDWSREPGVITKVDGNDLGQGYKKATLLPGPHVLEYAYYAANFGEHPKGRIEIDLAAGHSYFFDLDLCFWCNPRRYAVWIDDITVDKIAWGQHRDWPSWWL
jgi:hypothetical protein